MPTYCIDYFATIGRKNGQLTTKLIESNDDSGLKYHPKEIWDEAITDLAVIMEGDQVPDDTWVVIKKTLNGLDLFPPYVAFQRRKHSHKIDHIAEVRLVLEGAVIPKGFTLITYSVSGKFAYLNPIGFLAVRRVPSQSIQLINGTPSIDRLYVVLEAERSSCADDIIFSQVAHLPTTGPSTGPVPQFGVSIAYRPQPAIGLGNLVYESDTVDRYPRRDQKGSELPTAELPMFGFPHGLHLHYGSKQRYPLPQFFTFVFTNANGEHFYAECLRFYERVSKDQVESLLQSIYGYKLGDEVGEKTVTLPAGDDLFCPKVICLISRRPFYRAMRRYLRQLYSLSLSSIPCPIEYYIASLVNNVPLPMAGGRPIHFVLDAALISPTSKSLPPVTFALPNDRFFPHLDLDFAGPLRCLSVEILLAVFTLMLREAKLVFICRSNTLLTETMETLRALLFPLTWSSCFVSPLPDALSGLLEAPGGFMIGFHVSEDLFTDTDESNISKRLALGESLLNQQDWKHSLALGTYIVDLSSNHIYKHVYEDKDEVCMMNEVLDIIKVMPAGPRKRLQSKLHKIASDHGLGPMKNTTFEQYDSAFDFQRPVEDGSTPRPVQRFPTLEVRDAFVVFMIDLLGDYTSYIKPPSRDMLGDTFRTFQEGFAADEYLSQADPSMKQVIGSLLETQMFSVLLQQRGEDGQFSLVFFEKAAQLYRELGLSAGGHGDKIPTLMVSSQHIPDIPLPFFQLVGAHMLYEQRYGYWSQDETSLSSHNASSSTSSSMMSMRSSMMSTSSSSHSPTNSIKLRMSTSYEPTTKKQLSSSTTTSSYKQRKEYLAILLEFYNNSYDKFAKIYDWVDDSAYHEANISDTPAARDELDKGFDLELSNSSLGPVVIPGPIKPASNMKHVISQSNISYPDIHIDHEGRFTYQDCWPMMNDMFLELSSDSIHPRVKLLRAANLVSQNKVSHSVREMLRTSAERFAVDRTILPDITTSSTSALAALNSFGTRVYVDMQHIQSILVDVASISINLLATRTMQQLKVDNDIMQIVGILGQLEGVGLLASLDDCVWRAVLVACSTSGSELSKRLTCVIYDTYSSYLHHRHADVLSYGRFCQILSMKTKASEHDGVHDKISIKSYRKNDVLDMFYYLEEIGSSWFFDQRLSLLAGGADHRQQQLIRNQNVSGRYSGSMSRVSDMMMNPSMISSISHSPKITMKPDIMIPHVDTVRVISEQLSLIKDTSAIISFYHPKNLPPSSMPKHPSELTISSDSMMHVEATIQAIRNRSYDTANDINSIRDDRTSNDSNSKSRNLSSASSTSPLPRHRINSNNSNHDNNISPKATNSPMSSASASAAAASLGKMFSGGLKIGLDGTNSLISVTATSITTLGNQSKSFNINRDMKSNPSKANDRSPSSSSWMPSSRWLSSSMNNRGSISPQRTDSGNRTDRLSSNSTATLTTGRKMSADGFFLDDDDESDNSEETEGSSSGKVNSRKASHDVTAETSANPTSSSTEPEKIQVEDVDAIDVHHVHVDSTKVIEASDANDINPISQDTIVEQPTIQDSTVTPSPPIISSASQLEPSPAFLPCTSSTAIQHNIQAILADDIKSRANDAQQPCQGIGIHCQSKCQACEYAMLDEEIMATWFGYTSTLPDSKGLRRRSIRTIHHTSCPSCQQVLIPKLHIKCYIPSSAPLDDKTTPSYLSAAAKDVDVIWEEDVEYYSPFGLRAGIEDIMLRVGDLSSNPRFMHRFYPELFWNIIWYMTRASLPTGFIPHIYSSSSFLSNDASSKMLHEHDVFWSEIDHRRQESYASRGSLQADHVNMKWMLGPIIIGWREQLVRAKLGYLLQPSSSLSVQDINIDDLFPGCSIEEKKTIESIGHNMEDLSWTGMREAILDMTTLVKSNPNIQDAFEGGTVSFGRFLYLSLFHIAVVMKIDKIFQPHLSESVQTAKGCLFDRCYMDTVRTFLTSEDFLVIGKSSEALQADIPIEAARLFRMGLSVVI